LLGAHAGLRAQECTALQWADVQLARRGKGGKQRVVALSASLRQALQVLDRRDDGYVLGYRSTGNAWRRMRELCAAAEVAAKGGACIAALRRDAALRGDA
jgi:integrase